MTSNGTTNDVLVYVAGAAGVSSPLAGFDQGERCGLEDDRLGDLLLYPIALIVDHVEGELFAVEGVGVRDRSTGISSDHSVFIDDLVCAPPPDFFSAAVVANQLGPAAVSKA